MKKAMFLALVLVLVFALAAPAFAAPASADATFVTKLNVLPAIRVSFPNTNVLDFGSVVPGDKPSGTLIFQVDSNGRVSSQGAVHDLTFTDPMTGLVKTIPGSSWSTMILGPLPPVAPGGPAQLKMTWAGSADGVPWTWQTGAYSGSVTVTFYAE
jgi:hypothetical protein